MKGIVGHTRRKMQHAMLDWDDPLNDAAVARKVREVKIQKHETLRRKDLTQEQHNRIMFLAGRYWLVS